MIERQIRRLDGVRLVRRPKIAKPMPAQARISTPPPKPEVVIDAAAPVDTSVNDTVSPTRHRWRFWLGVSITVLLVTLAGLYFWRIRRPHAMSTTHMEFMPVVMSSTPAEPPVAASTSPITSVGLQAIIDGFVKTQNTNFYIYVSDLDSGATATYQADAIIESASLYKLYVANQIYRQIDAGKLSYDTTTGNGSDSTVADCLKLMITVSDNTCGQALGARLGWASQKKDLASQDLTEINLGVNPTVTSARDVGQLYLNLFHGAYLSTASQKAFLDLLRAQRSNQRLPQGLPAGTVIAHKTGELDGYMHDAGIVYGPKRDYVIVVMAGPWASDAASYVPEAKLSQLVYDYLEQ